MRERLTFTTLPLALDEKVNLDRQLARLPGVHHVAWFTKPEPHVDIVFADEKFVDEAAAARVLGEAGFATPVPA